MRVLHYLRYSRDYGLHYDRHPAVIEGYSDANWISDIKDSRSTSGYVFTLGGAAISWKSSKQTVIAKSTMESEFIALDKCGEEAEWLRQFVEDIPRWPKPVTAISIHCDSKSAMGRAKSTMYNGKSRHIRRRHNSIRQLLSTGVISIDYVASKDNIADPFTKGLSRELVKDSDSFPAGVFEQSRILDILQGLGLKAFVSPEAVVQSARQPACAYWMENVLQVLYLITLGGHPHPEEVLLMPNFSSLVKTMTVTDPELRQELALAMQRIYSLLMNMLNSDEINIVNAALEVFRVLFLELGIREFLKPGDYARILCRMAKIKGSTPLSAQELRAALLIAQHLAEVQLVYDENRMMNTFVKIRVNDIRGTEDMLLGLLQGQEDMSTDSSDISMDDEEAMMEEV
ncbi:hypothetical protein Tco_0461690 [Tanacetum coccineum]